MLDLEHIAQYHENNQLEAKLATGGLPHSIWETYSAFANSYGGVILLGVEELPDHTLRVQGLLNPKEIEAEFWNSVNDPTLVSANILRRDQVYTERTEKGDVVVIQVPVAARNQLPVYLGGNVFRGAYRRSGDGDYHCTYAEIVTMLEGKDH
ncbi:MAG: ATP-binding protein [Intestinimonas sp.]|jgi:predicted HTH transcriptional regulator|nr:ATP-binding protein [Intestinimonas sp.]